MAFTKEEMAAAQRMVESGMSGGEIAPGMEARAQQTQAIPIPLSRMLGEPEEVVVGNLRILLRPLSQGEMRRQFWPLAMRLPFFESALQTDGPGIDFNALATQASETLGTPVSAGMLARQWSVLQQDGQVSWLLSELVALMLVDDGTGPTWPHPDPGEEPSEDASPEVKTASLALLDAPAPEGRTWLDNSLDELTIGEWCDLLRSLIEVNAGYQRTAQSFERAANGG